MSGDEQLTSGLVRVWDQDRNVVGAGFLVSDRTVLTCSHVVAQALKMAEAELASHQGSVSIDFALIPAAAFRCQKASIVPLSAIPNPAGWISDIAVLRLDDEPPGGSRPLSLSFDPEIRQHEFNTFGFPSFSPHDNGDWAYGTIEGLGSAGLLQIRSNSRQGRRVQRGFSGAPVWDMESGCVVGMIAEADRDSDDRVAYAIPSRDLSAALADFTEPPQCPYRGLESFQEENSEFFFGREEFVVHLLSVIRERSLLAVTGPSGVGKSSVVAAGLAARLRNQHGWQVVKMRPGKQPFDALACIMLPLLEPKLTPVEQLDKSARLAKVIKNDGLSACLQIARQSAQLPLLLVIDQFEELFALSAKDDAKAFIDVLLQATNDHRGYEPDFCIVLTMRTEFLAEALDHPELAAAISPVEALGSMTEDQLRRAIEQPVINSNVKFADGLVARILQDTPDRGQLPLVEFLLMSLWEHQDGSALTHPAYQRLGGVGGALVQHAEQVFNRLQAEAQERARTVLMRLITVRNDAAPATCRVADRKDFDDRDWTLIVHLANQRLLLTALDLLGRQTVQIVHEALLSKWGRLNGWIVEDRKRLMLEAELRDAANRWAIKERDASWLLRGRALSEAEAWVNELLRETDPLVIEFIVKSLITESRNNGTRIRLQNAVRTSELTGDVGLKIDCLAVAIRFHLDNFEPFRAFYWWRRLWRYDAVLRDPESITVKSSWERAANRVWLIAAETFPISVIWLFSWFGISFLANGAIDYGEYGKLITMLATGLAILAIFCFVRRAFDHPLLCLPVVLLLTEFAATLPYVQQWNGMPYIKGVTWTAIAVAAFAVLLIYLLRRYRSLRRRDAESERHASFPVQ